MFNVEERLSTAVCVPAIRKAFKDWSDGGYKGITDTTRELLDFWFATDHQFSNGKKFEFHLAQRQAIETLIYLFEVEQVTSRAQLYEKYAAPGVDLRLSPHDDFARYCLKMATGSGKTLVMAMAVVWQFSNYLRGDTRYANNFLILAPNVIVFDRLKSDFESGQIFRQPYLIPKHISWLWDGAMEYYMRRDTERTGSEGALYLTNIQQFYERTSRASAAEPEQMTAVLGAPPPASKTDVTDFDDRIAERDGLVMVLNDEAHHTHDENNEWNKVIRGLHERRPVATQLDFSATPRYSGGGLFAWTVFDYPLKQAIIDKVVKRPIKGVSHIQEARSDIADVKYEGFLTAGVERWKEYASQLATLKKKPVLFIMMNSTAEADQICDWLQRKYPSEFGGEKTLVIHTDRAGDVSKKDLEVARKTARDVDHDESPVNAIVSVLMLREGWDVQNVTVVVGLRPYTAAANILPEQTIGRGLRLMFRDLAGSYQENVDVIGNKAFMEFVEQLEALEDLKFDEFKIGKDKVTILTIEPVDDKKDKDIGIPDISPILSRKASLSEEIEKIDVMTLSVNPLPLKKKDIDAIKTFIYEGKDIFSDETLFEREYEIPPAQTPEEVIGYYARRIAQNLKLPSQFSVLAPKVKDFFERKAFGKTVDLYDDTVIRAMSTNLATYVVLNIFEKILRDSLVEIQEAELLSANRFLSETLPFPTSKTVIDSPKTIFNYVECGNKFEKAFAEFLDAADDVVAFAKMPDRFNFCIQYTDSRANIRNYFPDFVAVLPDDSKWVIETKGREDIDVRLKDTAAMTWCENATELTGDQWRYLKVPQGDFERLHPDDFEELTVALSPSTLFPD